MANWSHWDESGGDRPNKAAGGDLARIQQTLGPYLQVYYDELPDAARAQLAADTAVAPGYAALGANLYGQYMPQYSAVGRGELAKDALAAAQAEYDIASGSGSRLAELAMGLQRREDQPYYASRDLIAGGLADWFAGQNPNALSGAERAEMEKTTARQVGYNPSAMNFAAGAMNTGQALEAKQGRFADNVTRLSSAIKPMQSGLDMTRIATGRSTQANPGTAAFSLPTTGQGQWAVQPGMAWNQNLQDYNRQRNMQQGTAGEIAGKMVGAVAAGAMCWVARAAYGEQDNRWKDFANWLFFDAPEWLHRFYMSAGPQLGEFVKLHKPVQRGLRFVMNKITKQKEGK
jgi:hypothetical protein